MDRTKQTHFYTYHNKRFENMKDCCKAIGNGIPSKALKHFLKIGLVKKVSLTLDNQRVTINSENENHKQER